MSENHSTHPAPDEASPVIADAAAGLSAQTPVGELWFYVARWFIALPPQEAVRRLMETVGRRAGADRVRLFTVGGQGDPLRLLLEWCAPGRPATAFCGDNGANGANGADKTDGGAAARLLLRLASKKLAGGRELLIAAPELLPRRHDDLRAPLQALGLCAYYAAPVLEGRRLVAFLEFHTIRAGHRWAAPERREMRAAARLVGDCVLARLPALTHVHPAAPGQPEGDSLFIEDGAVTVNIPLPQIVRIEADSNYSKVCLADGRHFITYRSMERWQELLAHRQFLRVHRSHLVNLRQITRFARNSGNWRLTLADRSAVPVGRTYQAGLLRQLEPMGEPPPR